MNLICMVILDFRLLNKLFIDKIHQIHIKNQYLMKINTKNKYKLQVEVSLRNSTRHNIGHLIGCPIVKSVSHGRKSQLIMTQIKSYLTYFEG